MQNIKKKKSFKLDDKEVRDRKRSKKGKGHKTFKDWEKGLKLDNEGAK